MKFACKEEENAIGRSEKKTRENEREREKERAYRRDMSLEGTERSFLLYGFSQNNFFFN